MSVVARNSAAQDTGLDGCRDSTGGVFAPRLRETRGNGVAVETSCERRRAVNVDMLRIQDRHAEEDRICMRRLPNGAPVGG